MNTSNTFRSHLMQQFVLHARNQSRTPPIALSGWLRNNNNQNDDDVTANDSDYHANINVNSNDHSIANTSRMMSTMDNNNNNTTDVATLSSSTSSTTARILPPKSQHHRVIPRHHMVSSSSSTPQPPPPPHSQRQQSRLLSTHDKNNSDHMNSHNNNDIIATLSSISVSSPVMMDTVQEISNQPQRFNHNRHTNVVPPPELSSSPLLWSSSPRDHFDHHHHHHYHHHHTPSELALTVQTIMSTRHTTNHFRHAAPETTDANQTPATANDPSPTPKTTTTEPAAISTALRQSSSQLLWYNKYDYEMAIVRAVRVGYTAPNHKRTEPYVFRRILKPETIERLANIAANVYYYHQMNKLRQEKMTATTTTDIVGRPDPPMFQPEGLDESQKIKHIIKGMEKKRDKWRNIPAFLVTLLESPSTKAQGVVTTTNHDANDNTNAESNVILPNVTSTSTTSTSTHVESTTTTTTESDEQDHRNDDPYAEEFMYRPLPFQPILTEQDCEDYASACAATQNVLLSLHSEQMATKWVTGPIIRTPALYDLLQLPVGDNHPERHQNRSRQQQQQQPENGSMASATTPQHRVVALMMIGQTAVTETDDDDMTVAPEHAAMDYFHQLQQQQRRRIPKRRAFQDLLQDL